jgi:2-iminoacetate synthase ThiH
MAGAEFGIRKEPEEFVEAIEAIGRIPAERTTTYERVDRSQRVGVATAR